MPSQVIRTWRYDLDDRLLTVTFVNGRQYAYADVPPDVAEDMRQAFAKGRFFNRRIRGRYVERPLQGASEGASSGPT